MSEPIRYEFIYNENFCSVEREEHPEGDYVRYEDYARLKAEVEELTGLLKASTYYNTSDEVTRLKAEVERLTKAGDAMASSIQFNEEMAKDYDGPTIVHQSVLRWNDAKEGKGHE